MYQSFKKGICCFSIDHIYIFHNAHQLFYLQNEGIQPVEVHKVQSKILCEISIFAAFSLATFPVVHLYWEVGISHVNVKNFNWNTLSSWNSLSESGSV